MPVGLANKNYLNVKNGNDAWMDAGGKPSKSDSKRHAVFSDPAYGVRAGILLLRTYFLTHELRTILEILSRWAPVSDTIGSQPGADPNNPTEYAIFVSRRMGVDHNQRLELFNADKTIRNVGQLRGLFYAMSAFEIGGGFKVPDKDFNAGLELVEPGITWQGTGTGEPPAEALRPAAKKWKISGSVGRVDKGAANDTADVSTVQSMLRSAAMILNDPRIDPGGIDGHIDPSAAKSDTVKAIVAFQSRFLTKPDGLIEVGGRTWGELVAVVSGAGEPVPAAAGAEFFPFASLPDADWASSPRRFSANRAGNRAHAGCDLYFPKGTTIHAITEGTVVRGPYPFYAATYAIEIDHGSFLARYGEVQKETMVREGDRVTAGQPIARVGHLVGISVASDMLHLEIYDKSHHGPLTTSAAQGAIAPNGRPYMRRKDLQDPTPRLNKWKDNLPGQPVIVIPGDATATPSRIPAKGFCIHIQRIREEKRNGMGFSRTIGNYQCYWDRQPIHDLGGQMAERGGPGDNTSHGVAKHLRIEAGKCRLSIQNGTRYKTYKYAASGFPLPGLLLLDTGTRSAILIHPCHDSAGYLSSIGCLNPAVGLKNADSRINLTDSRSRVIAIIEGMKARLGTDFPKQGVIPGAVVLIEGEPS